MTTRKKIWICLLCSILVYPCTNSENRTILMPNDKTDNILLLNAPNTSYNFSEPAKDFTKYNISLLHSPDHFFQNVTNTSSGSNKRRAYGKNLMVVLPVMQGNTDLTNSKLQALYTKAPVTTIIGQDSKDLNKRDVQPRMTPFPTKITREVTEKRVDYLTSDETLRKKLYNDTRHPYAELLFTKSVSKTYKSPLDYGYPESFKFVQVLNELPKNHKPEWASADIQEEGVDHIRTATDAMIKDDPFQMFESVKPLEINKLLSFGQTSLPSVTDSIIEEAATKLTLDKIEDSYQLSKRPLSKRPTKKPQKIKLIPQKFTEAELVKLDSLTSRMISTTTEALTTTTTKSTKFVPVTTTVSLSTSSNVTKDFTQTTKMYLPTPDMISSGNLAAANVTNKSNLSTVNIKPYLKWGNMSVNTTTAQSIDSGISSGDINVSNLLSLTKLLGDDFEPKNILTVIPPPKELTTDSPFPSDMLNGDMNNMLIALGILKSENEPSMFDPPMTVTTAKTPNFSDGEYFLQNMFNRRQQITPTIDPNSYVMFKKIPIDFQKQSDEQIGDEMKDLLSSFGLLPEKRFGKGNVVHTRVSRQHNVDKLNETIWLSNRHETFVVDEKSKMENKSLHNNLFPAPVEEILEKLELLQPLAYHSQAYREGHVFQPTVELEKLADEQKVQKINDAIETIRKISTSKDVENLSIEELEKQLKNVTALLKEENFVDVNETSSLSESDKNVDETEVKISTTTIAAITTAAFEVAETTFDSESSTPLNYNDVNYTSDESAVSLVKFSNNISVNTNESNLFMNQSYPLSSEEVQNSLETNKNNVKLQQSNDSLTTTTTTATTTTTTTTLESSSLTSTSTISSVTETADSSTKTVENNSAPFPDLAASFGGGDTASNEPSVNDLPTPKPNGLYFYMDWNTFLNIGEADRNPIRIRFSPRAGNPRNFLNIKVP